MKDFLSDPAWTGIAGIVAILTFIAYLLAEWKKIAEGSRELAQKVRARKKQPTRRDNLRAWLMKLGDFLGGSIAIDLIGIFAIITAIATFISKNPAYIVSFLLGVVPFLKGVHALRASSVQWAQQLRNNWYFTLLYQFLVIVVSGLVSYFLTPQPQTVPIPSQQELVNQLSTSVGLLLLWASFFGVVVPVIWAAIHQRHGRDLFGNKKTG